MSRIGPYRLFPVRKNVRLRNRSLLRLWEQDYRHYKKMIDAGYILDSKTGGWKLIVPLEDLEDVEDK